MKIICDIKSMPNIESTGADLYPDDILIKIPKNQGVVLWDSDNGGFEPKVVDVDSDLKVYDTNSDEGKEVIKKYLENKK